MATGGGASCLGRSDIGAIEPGRRADLACYPLDGIATAGAVLDPVEAAVRCGVRAARHTVVDGEIRVHDGRLVADPGDMVARHRAIALRWAEAAGAHAASGVLTGIAGPA